jgi:tungstate transport system substrate-binding protein
MLAMFPRRFRCSRVAIGAALLLGMVTWPVWAADSPFLTLASTTSTENSGLFDYLLPKFTAETGIRVHVVAVGTGAALDLGKRCDADALLVHAKRLELKYVAAGYGIDRHDVMYNDFVIVGPSSDPAHIAGMQDAAVAFAKVYHAKAVFLSRADKSGTNDKELELWKLAHLDPLPASGRWYKETGAGMGDTLNTARAMDAYTLSDRATWLSFRNKGDLRILVQGDPTLFNQYGVMMVNPKRCPEVKIDLARKFDDWLLSPRGQQVIGSYRLDGEQLFHPDAKKQAATLSADGAAGPGRGGDGVLTDPAPRWP